MRSHRCRALEAAVIVLFGVSGCERAPQRPAGDSVSVTEPSIVADTGEPAVSLNGWNPAAGPALFVATELPQISWVVFPHPTGELSDSVNFQEEQVTDVRVDLFSRVGAVGGGRVTGGFEPASRECVAWPQARIIPDEQVRPGATWTVALRAGAATALPADSLGALSRPDSARLATEVLRLASQVPSDPREPFHGLPFAARTVFRFHPVPGVEAIVSDVVRRISTEANPREEHTLIVAERDSASDAPFDLVYSERTSGSEETVVASDALAMLAIGPERKPTLVLSRDDGSGTIHALLERVGPARWHVRWASAYAGC